MSKLYLSHRLMPLKSIFLKLILSLGATLVTFLFFEVLARIYFRTHTDYHIEMSRYTAEAKEISNNPSIGHAHRKNYSGRLMNVMVHINSAGFRDKEYEITRNNNKRIIFLGDSLTFGWGVEQNKIFPALIEEELASISPVEIINFGCGNYTTVQEVEQFEKLGLEYSPDAVFLFYFINDAEELTPYSHFSFLSHSRLLTFIWTRVRHLFHNSTKPYSQYYSELYDNNHIGWTKAKESLQKLKLICSQHKIELKVFILPELHNLHDYPFQEEHAMIRKFLEQEGVWCKDLTEAFHGYNNARELWVANDDAHPNELAHRLIANRVKAFIKP
jgi:lysophospholipase L1-like esterase